MHSAVRGPFRLCHPAQALPVRMPRRERKRQQDFVFDQASTSSSTLHFEHVRGLGIAMSSSIGVPFGTTSSVLETATS